jgi:hypothetical protein
MALISEKHIALVAGIILGVYAGYFIATAGYGASYAIVFWCLFCPLVVCLITAEKTIWLAMVPNVLIWPTTSIVVQIQHPDERIKLLDIIGIVALTLILALISLLVSVPFQKIRSHVRSR